MKLQGKDAAMPLRDENIGILTTRRYPDRVPAFHGYSFSGNASAEYIYVGM